MRQRHQTSADAVLAQHDDARSDLVATDGMARLFEAEATRLRRYLSRFVSATEAEDIVQECFARLSTVTGAVRSSTGLLYQIARNMVIDHKRREARKPTVPMDEVALLVVDPHCSPEKQAEHQQLLRDAARMLEAMSPRRREIFLLQVVDGLSYAAIAERLSISVPAVKKQLLRAFEHVSRHVAKSGAHFGSGSVRRNRRRL